MARQQQLQQQQELAIVLLCAIAAHQSWHRLMHKYRICHSCKHILFLWYNDRLFLLLHRFQPHSTKWWTWEQPHLASLHRHARICLHNVKLKCPQLMRLSIHATSAALGLVVHQFCRPTLLPSTWRTKSGSASLLSWPLGPRATTPRTAPTQAAAAVQGHCRGAGQQLV